MNIQIVGPGNHFLHKEDYRRDYFDLGILVSTHGREKENLFMFDSGVHSASAYLDMIGSVEYERIYGLVSHGHGDHVKGFSQIINYGNIEKLDIFGPRGYSVNPEALPQGIISIIHNMLKTENRGVGEVGTKLNVTQICENNIQFQTGLYPKGRKFYSKQDTYVQEPMSNNIYQILNDLNFDITAILSSERHGSSKDWVLGYSLTEKTIELKYDNLDPEKYALSSVQMKSCSKKAKTLVRKIVKKKGSLINSKQDLIESVQEELRRQFGGFEAERDRMAMEYDQLEKHPEKFSEGEKEKIQGYKPTLKKREASKEALLETNRIIVEIVKNEEIFYCNNKFTYISDMTMQKDRRLFDLADNSDVLYCGATHITGESQNHLSLEDAVEIAKQSNSKKLVIGHINTKNILGAVRYMKLNRRTYKPKWLTAYLPNITAKDLDGSEIRKKSDEFKRVLNSDSNDFQTILALPNMSFPVKNRTIKLG